jgi:N-acetylglucosamine kinase-like BadF-type ATPase
MACAIMVARRGQQRSLARIFQVLSWATARSPRARLTCGTRCGPKAGVAPALISPPVAAHFGLPSAEEVGRRVHLAPSTALDRADLAGLTPVLFGVAAAGDDVARRVVVRQAEEIVALATVAARRLGLLGSPFVVVLGGGVVRARHRLLMDPVAEGIRSAAPEVTIAVVDAPPVLGAGLSALDALGSDRRAREALREGLSRL